MDPRIKHLDSRILVYNLYLTQGILLLIGMLSTYFFIVGEERGWGDFFALPNQISSLWIGLSGGLAIILLEVVLNKVLPQDEFDDGGINEKIFRSLGFAHIFFVAFIVAFTEEVLFRGVIQEFVGIWWASIIFTIIHVRYLKKWMMVLVVFLISLAFGWMYQLTGSLWTSILAHFLVDFVLGVFIRLGWFQSEEETEEDMEELAEETDEVPVLEGESVAEQNEKTD